MIRVRSITVWDTESQMQEAITVFESNGCKIASHLVDDLMMAYILTAEGTPTDISAALAAVEPIVRAMGYEGAEGGPLWR